MRNRAIPRDRLVQASYLIIHSGKRSSDVHLGTGLYAPSQKQVQYQSSVMSQVVLPREQDNHNALSTTKSRHQPSRKLYTDISGGHAEADR